MRTQARDCPVARSFLRTVAARGALALAAIAACGCRAFYGRSIELNPLGRGRGLAAESVSEVLALDEKEIDIGRAALLVAREDRPGLDIASYLGRLDELAARLARRLPARVSVRRAVEETARLLRVHGDRSPPARRRRPEPASEAHEAASGGLPAEMDLSRILDGDRGNCLGLTLLYLAVAERAGLPLAGVAAPEHYFVRFDDGVTRVNMELTQGGRAVPDGDYIRSRRISREAIDRGIYLRSESKRQVIASLLSNRAALRALAGRFEEALADAERALAVKPYWPQGLVNRGLALELSGRAREAERDYLRALELDPHCASALNNLAALYLTRATEGRAGGPAGRAAGRAPSGHPPAGPEEAGALLESAFRMAERAVSLAPARPEFHETAAACAAAIGERRAARRWLRRAIQLAPGEPRYAEALERLED